MTSRADVNKQQRAAEICFLSYSQILSPICPDTYGVIFFFVKIYIICEKLVFSLDRSSMQIFTLKITRVV